MIEQDLTGLFMHKGPESGLSADSDHECVCATVNRRESFGKIRELLMNTEMSIHTRYCVVKPFSIPHFDSFHAVFLTEDRFQ